MHHKLRAVKLIQGFLLKVSGLESLITVTVATFFLALGNIQFLSFQQFIIIMPQLLLQLLYLDLNLTCLLGGEWSIQRG